MERKRKRKAKTRKSLIDQKDEHAVQDLPELEVEGVEKIILSTLTQKAIGCVAGENITSEDAWMFVKKEKFADNLDLHEESSEFLPIKQVIVDYPEEDILVGYRQQDKEGREEFYICGTVNAKETVLNLLEEQKNELHDRVKNSLVKIPGSWKCLGSDVDVDDNLPQNFRPLYEIELESKYPLCDEKKKFSMRLVQDAIDGYVEVLPGRFPVSNVFRKRIDASTQVTPQTVIKSAQTIATYPRNIYTQYSFDYQMPVLTPDISQKLSKFLVENTTNLFESITENENVNLHTDEYKRNAKKIVCNSLLMSRDLKSFRDVIACKNKNVSDAVLNPLISGIYAVSYSKAPPNSIYRAKPTIDEVNEVTFEKNLVLIWCIKDNLKPKMYLHSFREVNVVSYCPYKRSFIVGGCTNGQIVIWHLGMALEKLETREILTHHQQKHRIIMRSMMKWMKHTIDPRVSFPTVVSSLEHGHTDAITGIQWILPNHEVTRNGKIENLDGTNRYSMQFMTCGLDGKILIWDITKKDDDSKGKKAHRSTDRPANLNVDESEYRHLNNTLIPHFKLIVENPRTKLPYPLTGIIVDNLNFTYLCENPETKENIFLRTYFQPIKSEKSYHFTNTITAITKLGQLLIFKWDGHEFDQGQKINCEYCNVIEYRTIHDGPLKSCTTNYFEDNCLLTVGGKVFAVWDKRVPQIPLFWRKGVINYVCGIWSYTSPASVVIARKDAYFEVWDLLQKTKAPSRIIRLTGNPILNVFSESSKVHVRKGTFLTTDIVGALRLYGIPGNLEMVHYNLDIAKLIRERILHRRKQFRDWIEKYKLKFVTESFDVDDEPDIRKTIQEHVEDYVRKVSLFKRPEQSTDKTPAELWNEKQEKLMYEILLEKKKINLTEIEQHKGPLEELLKEKEYKKYKIQISLNKKEKVFDTAKDSLLKDIKIKKKRKIAVSFPESVERKMKAAYKEDYKVSEEIILKDIKLKPFQYTFNWNTMMAESRAARQASLVSNQLPRRQACKNQKKIHIDNSITFQESINTSTI